MSDNTLTPDCPTCGETFGTCEHTDVVQPEEENEVTPKEHYEDIKTQQFQQKQEQKQAAWGWVDEFNAHVGDDNASHHELDFEDWANEADDDVAARYEKIRSVRPFAGHDEVCKYCDPKTVNYHDFGYLCGGKDHERHGMPSGLNQLRAHMEQHHDVPSVSKPFINPDGSRNTLIGDMGILKLQHEKDHKDYAMAKMGPLLDFMKQNWEQFPGFDKDSHIREDGDITHHDADFGQWDKDTVADSEWLQEVFEDNPDLYDGLTPESTTDHVYDRHDEYQTYPIHMEEDDDHEDLRRKHDELGPHDHLGKKHGQAYDVSMEKLVRAHLKEHGKDDKELEGLDWRQLIALHEAQPHPKTATADFPGQCEQNYGLASHCGLEATTHVRKGYETRHLCDKHAEESGWDKVEEPAWEKSAALHPIQLKEWYNEKGANAYHDPALNDSIYFGGYEGEHTTHHEEHGEAIARAITQGLKGGSKRPRDWNSGRPNHVYLATDSGDFGEAGASHFPIRVDMRKLNPDNLNSDEDAHGYAAMTQSDLKATRFRSVGELAEADVREGMSDIDDESSVEDSMRNRGSFAHKGDIPPDALDINPHWAQELKEKYPHKLEAYKRDNPEFWGGDWEKHVGKHAPYEAPKAPEAPPPPPENEVLLKKKNFYQDGEEFDYGDIECPKCEDGALIREDSPKYIGYEGHGISCDTCDFESNQDEDGHWELNDYDPKYYRPTKLTCPECEYNGSEEPGQGVHYDIPDKKFTCFSCGADDMKFPKEIHDKAAQEQERDFPSKTAHMGDDLGFHHEESDWEKRQDTERTPDTTKVHTCATCGEPWKYHFSDAINVYVRRHDGEDPHAGPLGWGQGGHRAIDADEIIGGITAHMGDDLGFHHEDYENRIGEPEQKSEDVIKTTPMDTSSPVYRKPKPGDMVRMKGENWGGNKGEAFGLDTPTQSESYGLAEVTDADDKNFTWNWSGDDTEHISPHSDIHSYSLDEAEKCEDCGENYLYCPHGPFSKSAHVRQAAVPGRLTGVRPSPKSRVHSAVFVEPTHFSDFQRESFPNGWLKTDCGSVFQPDLETDDPVDCRACMKSRTAHVGDDNAGHHSDWQDRLDDPAETDNWEEVVGACPQCEGDIYHYKPTGTVVCEDGHVVGNSSEQSTVNKELPPDFFDKNSHVGDDNGKHHVGDFEREMEGPRGTGTTGLYTAHPGEPGGPEVGSCYSQKGMFICGLPRGHSGRHSFDSEIYKREAHVGDDNAAHHSNVEEFRKEHPYWDTCPTCSGMGLDINGKSCSDCKGLTEAFDFEYWDTDEQLHDFANYPNIQQVKPDTKFLEGHLGQEGHKQNKKDYDDPYAWHLGLHGRGRVDPDIVPLVFPEKQKKQKAAHKGDDDYGHLHNTDEKYWVCPGYPGAHRDEREEPTSLEDAYRSISDNLGYALHVRLRDFDDVTDEFLEAAGGEDHWTGGGSEIGGSGEFTRDEDFGYATSEEADAAAKRVQNFPNVGLVKRHDQHPVSADTHCEQHSARCPNCGAPFKWERNPEMSKIDDWHDNPENEGPENFPEEYRKIPLFQCHNCQQPVEFPNIPGEKTGSVRLGMALTPEAALPEDLRKTIEEFRKLPNVHRMMNPEDARMRCGVVSRDFADFAKSRGHEKVHLRNLRQEPWNPSWATNYQSAHDNYEGEGHQVAHVDGYHVDWSARQYDANSPVPRVYKKLGIGDAVGTPNAHAPNDPPEGWSPEFTRFYKEKDWDKQPRTVGWTYDMMQFREGAPEWDKAYMNPPYKKCNEHDVDGEGSSCFEMPEGHIPARDCKCEGSRAVDCEHCLGTGVEQEKGYWHGSECGYCGNGELPKGKVERSYRPVFDPNPECPAHGGEDNTKAYFEKHQEQKVAGTRTRTWYLNQRDSLVRDIGPDTSTTVHDFGDGWTIKKLQTVGDARIEGKLMKNCIKKVGEEGKTCESCWGSGKCSNCQGVGKLRCDDCEGVGSELCPACRGKGWAINKETPCTRCKSYGRIGCKTCDTTGRTTVCEKCATDEYRFATGKCKPCRGHGRIEETNETSLDDANHIYKDKSGKSAIYSLRDPDNIPQSNFTLIQSNWNHTGNGYTLGGLYGRANKVPRDEYGARVTRFFKDFVKDKAGDHIVRVPGEEDDTYASGVKGSFIGTPDEAHHHFAHENVWDDDCDVCLTQGEAFDKTADANPGGRSNDWDMMDRPLMQQQPRGGDPWKDVGDTGVPLNTRAEQTKKVKKLLPGMEVGGPLAPDSGMVMYAADSQTARLRKWQTLHEELGPDKSKVVHRFDDGWTINHITKGKDIYREGVAQSHCWDNAGLTGDNEGFKPAHAKRYDYEPTGDAQQQLMHMSLRDENGLPRVSFYHDPPGKKDWRGEGSRDTGMSYRFFGAHDNTSWMERHPQWGKRIEGWMDSLPYPNQTDGGHGRGGGSFPTEDTPDRLYKPWNRSFYGPMPTEKTQHPDHDFYMGQIRQQAHRNQWHEEAPTGSVMPMGKPLRYTEDWPEPYRTTADRTVAQASCDCEEYGVKCAKHNAFAKFHKKMANGKWVPKCEECLNSSDASKAYESTERAYDNTEWADIPITLSEQKVARIEPLDLPGMHPSKIDDRYFDLVGAYNTHMTRANQYAKLSEDYKAKAVGPLEEDYYVKSYAKTGKEYEAKANALKPEMKMYEDEFQRRGGWSRYVLCASDGGHIHRNSCHTLTPGKTKVSLVHEASGMNAKELVDTYGYSACTHCFPEAPSNASWMKGKALSEEEAATKKSLECPGSRTYEHDSSGTRYYSPRAVCNHCKQTVSLTSTHKMRVHKPRPKTATNVRDVTPAEGEPVCSDCPHSPHALRCRKPVFLRSKEEAPGDRTTVECDCQTRRKRKTSQVGYDPVRDVSTTDKVPGGPGATAIPDKSKPRNPQLNHEADNGIESPRPGFMYDPKLKKWIQDSQMGYPSTGVFDGITNINTIGHVGAANQCIECGNTDGIELGPDERYHCFDPNACWDRQEGLDEDEGTIDDPIEMDEPEDVPAHLMASVRGHRMTAQDLKEIQDSEVSLADAHFQIHNDEVVGGLNTHYHTQRKVAQVNFNQLENDRWVGSESDYWNDPDTVTSDHNEDKHISPQRGCPYCEEDFGHEMETMREYVQREYPGGLGKSASHQDDCNWCNRLSKRASDAAMKAASGESRSEREIERRTKAGSPPSENELAENLIRRRLNQEIADRYQREYEEHIVKHDVTSSKHRASPGVLPQQVGDHQADNGIDDPAKGGDPGMAKKVIPGMQRAFPDNNKMNVSIDNQTKTGAASNQELRDQRDHELEIIGENEDSGPYEDQAQTVHKFPDKWTIKRLRTYGDMDYEGRMMSHCVGGEHAKAGSPCDMCDEGTIQCHHCKGYSQPYGSVDSDSDEPNYDWKEYQKQPTTEGFEPCDTCEQTGQAECRSCYGKGHEIMDKSKVCIACKGDGKETCRDCKGAGEMPCDKCKGMTVLDCDECDEGMVTGQLSNNDEYDVGEFHGQTGATGDFYSLRNPDNVPHVTFYHEYDEPNCIPQALGRSGDTPKPEYQHKVLQFAKKNMASHGIEGRDLQVNFGDDTQVFSPEKLTAVVNKTHRPTEPILIARYNDIGSTSDTGDYKYPDVEYVSRAHMTPGIAGRLHSGANPTIHLESKDGGSGTAHLRPPLPGEFVDSTETATFHALSPEKLGNRIQYNPASDHFTYSLHNIGQRDLDATQIHLPSYLRDKFPDWKNELRCHVCDVQDKGDHESRYGHAFEDPRPHLHPDLTAHLFGEKTLLNQDDFPEDEKKTAKVAQNAINDTAMHIFTDHPMAGLAPEDIELLVEQGPDAVADEHMVLHLEGDNSHNPEVLRVAKKR